jgi:hypothetical protein
VPSATEDPACVRRPRLAALLNEASDTWSWTFVGKPYAKVIRADASELFLANWLAE